MLHIDYFYAASAFAVLWAIGFSIFAVRVIGECR
jgi:hypothetical protein